MKSRLPVVGCCLLTTLLIGIWLGQSLPLKHKVHEEILERSTVSPFNSDGWQLASGQEFGPSATLRTESPFGRALFSDHPASSSFHGERVEPSDRPVGPDVAYFPEVITEAGGETSPQSSASVWKAHSRQVSPVPATLSQEDAAVWNAELKDLPADQAEEILNLRRQLGSVAAESLGLSFPEMPIPEMPIVEYLDPPGLFPEVAAGDARPIPIAEASPTDALVIHASAAKESPLAKQLREEAERNYAENIANAKTPGYKRRQIVLLNVSVAKPIKASIEPAKAVHAESEASDAPPDAVTGGESHLKPWLSRLDLRQGEMTPTSNPLDLAIDGHGWLKVERNGQEEFVRTGMLGFDSEGWLGIHTAAGLLPIIPKLQVPSDQQRIIVAGTGEVYAEKTLVAENDDGAVPILAKLVVFDFRNASALKRTPVGTYAATAESGSPLTSRPNSVQFLQAVLEESNVDRETEISNTMHLYEAAEQLSQSVALP